MQVVVNGNILSIPNTVVMLNEEFLNNYKTLIDGKEFFTLDDAIKENKLPEIKRMFDQMCGLVGEITIEEKIVSNEVWEKIRNIDNLYNFYMKNNDYEKAIPKLMAGLEIMLNVYSTVMKTPVEENNLER